MLKVLVGYPTTTEEFVIVERMTGALQAVQRAIDAEHLIELQRAADAVFVDPVLIEYAVKVVAATRAPQTVGQSDLNDFITYGASPRASINLILCARALALLRGRAYALPQDVTDIIHDVIRHRLALSYKALAQNVTSDELLDRIINAIPLPEVPLNERRFPVGATFSRTAA
jgi:MoxR-like ATPase